jgi:hypothetical protein
LQGKDKERHMNILKWNAGGLSSPKMTEIKKTINEKKTQMFLSSITLISPKKTLNSIT